MNIRGFTLVELVAILVVLAAIFLVSFPTLTNMAKKDNAKEYDDMVKNLCLSGKTYIYANLDTFTNVSIVGSKLDVEIETLITYGNVKNDTINPKTKKIITNDSLTYTVLDDYSLDCEYNEG